MKRVAADENLHYLFYRDLVSAALDIDPSGTMEAIKRQVLSFEMPGTGIPHFAQHARAIARAGIYDLSVHHDAILRPVVLGHWDAVGRQDLTPSAEAARDRLVQFITRLGRVSARVKERRTETLAEAAASIVGKSPSQDLSAASFGRHLPNANRTQNPDPGLSAELLGLGREGVDLWLSGLASVIRSLRRLHRSGYHKCNSESRQVSTAAAFMTKEFDRVFIGHQNQSAFGPPTPARVRSATPIPGGA